MGIRKQDYYEGAALHLLVRGGRVTCIRYQIPLFFVNNRLFLHLKYSTKGRSPWGFTFMPEEVALLERKKQEYPIVIGLICGSDGVASFQYDEFRTIAPPSTSALHIACYRDHGKHYEVNGPEGPLAHKVAPSSWQRILGDLENDEA